MLIRTGSSLPYVQMNRLFQLLRKFNTTLFLCFDQSMTFFG